MDTPPKVIPSPRTYRLQPDETEVFSVGTNVNSDYVLIGVHPNPFLQLVLFDKKGNFSRIETRRLSSNESEFAWDELRKWKNEIGFRSSPIVVKRFMLSYECIGITDLPEFMYNYLELAPAENDTGYRDGMYEDIQTFINDEQFVLIWCGKEFWMSHEGEVTDS